MDFLPFEIYPAPFPRNKYGLIYEIPEYCSEKELEVIRGICESHVPPYTKGIPSDVYPNLTSIHNNLPLEKSFIIHEQCRKIFNHYEINLPADYRFSRVGDSQYRESCEFILHQRIQGNPKSMKEYPIHIDAGKCMTLLVPLSPVQSVPTRFHGIDYEQHVFRTIPWKINHAYLFCSSPYSSHSYVGDGLADRWILNINIFDMKYVLDTERPERFLEQVEYSDPSYGYQMLDNLKKFPSKDS